VAECRVGQYDFYINDRDWGRMFVAVTRSRKMDSCSWGAVPTSRRHEWQNTAYPPQTGHPQIPSDSANCRPSVPTFLMRQRFAGPRGGLKQKLMNGFRSDWGAKAYADLCSIVATGCLDGRSPRAAIRAALTIR
jgi:hypothetical protein